MVQKTQNLENKTTSFLMREVFDGEISFNFVEKEWPSNGELREILYILCRTVRHLPADEIAIEMIAAGKDEMKTSKGLNHVAVKEFICDIVNSYPQADIISAKTNSERIVATKFRKILKRRYTPEWVFLFCKAMGKLRLKPNYSFAQTKDFLVELRKKRGRKPKLNLPEHAQQRSLMVINEVRKTLPDMIRAHIAALNWNLEIDNSLINHVALYGLDYIVRTIIDMHFEMEKGAVVNDNLDAKLREIMTLSRWFSCRLSKRDIDPKFSQFLHDIADHPYIPRPTADSAAPMDYNYDMLKIVDLDLCNIEFERSSKISKVENGGKRGSTQRVLKTKRKRSKGGDAK